MIEYLTPTQKKLLAVLADGMPHPISELCAAIDSQCVPGNVVSQFTLMRKVLRPAGHDIICQLLHRKTYYRHVRLLKSSSE